MPLDQAIAEATGAIADLPTVSIKGLDVLLPGRHTGVKGGANDYTTDDLVGIAQAHDELAGVIRPVGKLGHRPQDIVAEYPNIGNITRAYVADGRLKVDMDNVPARVAALQKAGNLPARSAELLFNVQHGGKTYPKVLTGLSFLGESLPAVRSLNDILHRYQSGDTPAEVLLSADDADEVLLADAATKTEDGKAFPKSDYAYTPSDTPSDWKLRLTAEPGGKPDAGIVGAAAAALGAGFRGQKVEIPAADLPAVKAKVRAAWQKANPDKKTDEMPKSIALAAEPMSDSDKAEAAAADCKDPKHDSVPPALHKKMHMPVKKAALSLDLDEVRAAVEDALQDAYPDTDPYGMPLPSGDDGPSSWIECFYDDSVVVWDQDHDSYWQIPYTFDATSSSATLGEPKPCRLVPQIIAGADAELASTPDAMTTGGGSIPAQPNALTTDYAPHIAAMQDHLSAVGDLLNKMAGKHGVGPTRAMHRELSSKVAGLKKKLVPADPTEETQHAAASAAIGAAMSAPEGETMQDTDIRALLSLPPEADIKQALIRLQATHVELADHQAVVAERDALKADHEALLAEKAEADAVALVDKAIENAKVLPKQRDWFVNLARKDRESVEVFLASAPTLWQTGEIGRTGAGSDLSPTGEPAPVSPKAAELAKAMGIDPTLLADTRTTAEKIAAQDAAKEQQRAATGNARQFVRS